MERPFSITSALPTEPVLSVDGAWGAPGLNLSHWPGNQTPAELRHRLSTGAALGFAALPPAERERLAAGATRVVNNHYDTDGALGMWSLVDPLRALPHRDAMLQAAAAGDFFQFPGDQAFAIDALVGNLGLPERSPLEARAGEPSEARHERQLAWLFERFDALFSGDLSNHRELWEPELEDAHADLRDLEGCEREDHVALDWTHWRAPKNARSTRAQAVASGFDPGRHALFGSTPCDRVLVTAERDGGTCYRFLVSTLSWFDLPDRERARRPDLEGLAGRFNELEGTSPEGSSAWRAQPATGASPELWFGGAELDSFSEHSPVLTPSSLPEERVRAVLLEELSA